MKLVNLSLVAITVVGLSASAFAADTLAGAFKEGKVNGTLQAWYFSNDTGVKSANILDLGLDLSYKTGTYKGFSAAATVQSTHSPFANDTAKSLYKTTMYGAGEVFSEAYVKYAVDKAFLKAGRQYIWTPLVAGSGTRMTRESFEGYLLGYIGLPQTKLLAGYIYAFQTRTSGTGDIGTFSHKFSFAGGGYKVEPKGAYTIYINNKSITGLNVQAQWAEVVDFVDLYYAQADYTAKANNFSYGLSGQVNVTDYKNSTTYPNNSGYYGLKVSAGVNALKVYAAYSQVNSDANAIAGLGFGSSNIFTKSYFYGGTYTKNTKAYALDGVYTINKNISVGARWSHLDNGTVVTKYTNAQVKYKFDGALKGLTTLLQYEGVKKDNAADGTYFEFEANYKF